MQENPLHLLMNPVSIATVGAGNNPMKMGTLQALSITKNGYGGKFYPVHPTEASVLGHKAYPSVPDLPEPPDLAVLIVPTNQVAGLLEAFGQIGTKRAVVITAGFKETGSEGKSAEEQLRRIAAQYGMRFLGPNCMGIINTQLSLNLTLAQLDPRPGSLGLASQSGTYVTQILSYLRKRGIRFSKAVSVGNEADIDIVDVMEYLAEDEHTKAIILYIEGIRNGRRFIESAQRISRYKPIVAQYVGGSKAGARAGLSHTGAMAGPDVLYEGIFRQAGIIRVHSIEDLYARGWALAAQPPLAGKRIGVVTNSGGPGTAISHTADQGGLEVPTFSTELQEHIRPLIPPHASCANPVDLTFNLDTELLSTTIPDMIMKSGEVDGLIIHGAMSTGVMKEFYPHVKSLLNDLSEEQFLAMFKRDLAETVGLPGKYNKPIMVSTFFDRDDQYTEAYMDADIPVFFSPEKAAAAMASLLRYKEIRERRSIERPALPRPISATDMIIKAALQKRKKALDEYESKRILSAYGLPVARGSLANSEGEAVYAAENIGFPVAVKACSWEVMHKTGKDLIVLNVQTEEGVRKAFQSIRRASRENMPVLVQEMVKGSRELTAGMSRFPNFGPCILFGLGGIFMEVVRDTVFRSAPISRTEAEEMIFDIRGREILGGIRGMPPVDTASLINILQGVSHIAMLHDDIAEIDLNPIIISGSKPVIADALFVLKS